LDWVGLGWVGLGWVGLGWVGLGKVGLGWVASLRFASMYLLIKNVLNGDKYYNQCFTLWGF